MLPEKIVHANRWNVYCLVQKGFSREECYNMPVEEFREYIRYNNQEAENIQQQQLNSSSSNSPDNEPHYAGNTVPGM